MNTQTNTLRRLGDRLSRQLAPHQQRLTAVGHELLRLSLGFVFLLFGALKFVPGVSPAEDIAVRAMTDLSFGLLPAGVALFAVALMETAIGLSLLTGRFLRLGVALLGAAMVGVLSPLVLFPGELFAGSFLVPTLMGQYVIKDVVLLAAAFVVAVRVYSRRPAERPAAGTRSGPSASRPRQVLPLDLERAA
jgi:uncharacterized membrane protein YkgB